MGLNCKPGTTLESRTEVCSGGSNDQDYSNRCDEYLNECPSGVDLDDLWEIIVGDWDPQPLINGFLIFLAICATLCIIGCIICRISYIKTVKKIGTNSHINNSKRQQQQPAASSSGHQHVASQSIAFVAVQQPVPQPQQVIVVQAQPVQPIGIPASAPPEYEPAPASEAASAPPEYVPAPASEATSDSAPLARGM